MPLATATRLEPDTYMRALAGPGGRQIQVEDPDGNPIEPFEFWMRWLGGTIVDLALLNTEQPCEVVDHVSNAAI
jgi:hypothetical protein